MNRTIIKITVLLILMMSLSGCFLKSVHPLITSENAIILDGLDGVYETEDQRWIFASDSNPKMVAELIRQYPSDNVSFDPGEEDSLGFDAYLILFQNKQSLNDQKTLFLGMVGEIDGQLYLNMKIFDISIDEGSSFANAHIFNVNTFSKIELNDQELIMEPFASNWIGDQIRNNRVRIKHESVYSEFDDSSEILITASTKELREFVRKYGSEEDAYEDPITLKRSFYEIQ